MPKFKPGVSGNPKGRPPGPTPIRKLREMFVPHTPALVSKAVELALEGNEGALKICLDRVIPALKPEAPAVAMEGIQGSLSEQGAGILRALVSGEITPDHGVKLLQGLQALTAVKSTSELEARIEALETAVLKATS